MAPGLLFISVVFITVCFATAADIRTRTREEILASLFNAGYDDSIPPNFNEDNPTDVTVQLFILSIHSFSETDLEFKVQLILRQTWVDSRLSFNFTDFSNTTNRYMRDGSDFLEVTSDPNRKIWEPDTFFLNQREGRIASVTTENKLFHIQSNGTIIYSIRVALTLSCELILHRYPFDRQTCPITILSYAYTVNNIVFHWHPRPVTFRQRELPQFDIDVAKLSYTDDTEEYDDTGVYSRLKVHIPFERKVGYYVLQIFLPCVLIVMVSWVNFFLDKDAVPARASISIVTVLTITTLSSSARDELPPVSYVKAIDVWLFACQLFVFLAMLEFAYVNVQTRRIRKYELEDAKIELDETDANKTTSDNTEESAVRRVLRTAITCLYPGYRREAKYYGDSRARFVDHMSRRIFPLAFVLFLIVFFAFVSTKQGSAT